MAPRRPGRRISRKRNLWIKTKLIFGVVLLLAIYLTNIGLLSKAVLSNVENTKDFLSPKQRVINHCAEKHKISKDFVKEVIEKKSVPDDRNVKCWLSCIFKKSGVLKNGKLKWKRCRNLIKWNLPNNEDLKKVNKIINICSAEVSNDEKDECQLAYSMAVCLLENWNEDHLEDYASLKKHAIVECSEQHKIGKDVVNNIVNHINVPNDYQDTKCWLHCFLEKLGVIKEGSIDWERFKQLGEMGLMNEEDKVKFDKIVEKCQVEVPQNEKDGCQLAYSMAVCKLAHWNELSLPIGNLEK